MPKKILIIESDAQVYTNLKKALDYGGYSASVISDGAIAAVTIHSYKPDLIILDSSMPIKDGSVIMTELKEDELLKKTPVIIILNSDQTSEMSNFFELGVKDYLFKDKLNSNEIIQKVATQLGDILKQQGGKGVLIGKKILWVEDDKFLGDIVERKLTSTGCTFVHAISGEEAFKYLEHDIPDIFVLDIVLPVMDGFEILKKIKTDQKINRIPVIMLSNLSQDADIAKGKQLGADLYFVKALITLDEVIIKIVELVNR